VQLVMPEGQRPHLRRYCGRGVGPEDAADNRANLLEQVVVVIAPFAGWARVERALEDELDHSVLWRGKSSFVDRKRLARSAMEKMKRGTFSVKPIARFDKKRKTHDKTTYEI
jgi:hypothetical protein